MSQTFYRWKRKFAGMGIAELRRLRQLEDENKRLKQLVADLTLDKHMLQEVITKNSGKRSAPRVLQAPSADGSERWPRFYSSPRAGPLSAGAARGLRPVYRVEDAKMEAKLAAAGSMYAAGLHGGAARRLGRQ